ncbi:guanine deaminase [filamentous cyanobacterium LEGE 11480]|uniref:Guanine deaminase n=1 Tax=Romeriopsis navalis LEGE 11480 TaxID=2777977 RepID=A0A928VQG1_9CYAN|nr:guanine deaminase [Romeriopsis navalis LEGE 11480]
MRAIRGAFFDFVDDPFLRPEMECLRYIADGLLVIDDGLIESFGEYREVRANYPAVEVTHYPGKLITPGLIDLHIHLPQTEMIAAYGEQLMEWLEKYTFPTERKFANPDYARRIAAFFLDELLRNGTTTALVLTTIFAESVEVLFQEAQKRQMRIIGGQVLMSRNAPDYLLKDPATAYAEVKQQIQQWHGIGRSRYAITPRFAITSTPEELELAGQLKAEFPDVYVHTHLSENRKEIEFTAELFPECDDYLHVYEKFGLVGDRSIFAHCIHLEEGAFQRLAEAGSTITHCPTSNFFLGSGLFPLHKSHGAKIGLGTDVGAGTSFSQFATMAAAYQTAQLQGQSLSAFKAFYLATLGGAQALSLASLLGNFAPGKEADFVVLDWQATPLMQLRNPELPVETLEQLESGLFGLMILGDDRAVAQTYIAGRPALQRNEAM